MATRFAGLTAEHKAVYERDGYLVLDRLLGDADLAAVREAMTLKVDTIAVELLRDGKISDALQDEPFEDRLAKLFASLTDADFLKYGPSWRDRLPGYFTLMSNPKILNAVESLIGPEVFANPVFNVRPKVPKVAAGAVPWHQDKSYWPDANPNQVITVWIPVVDSTLENGCLHLIPGTHRERVIEYASEQHTGAAYLQTNLDLVEREAKKRAIVALPVSAGSAILFNDRLLHSSTPNNSDHVRWSVDVRYQPTDQDAMTNYGAGFLARSRLFPQRVATLQDWIENRAEHADA